MREWQGVLDSRAFVGGPAVPAFERRFAAFCGTAHAVGTANGTDALHLALRALGLGPGDEVVVPANTFVATVEAVVLAGAEPRFADVDPDTLLLTPETMAATAHAADPGGRRGAPLRADGRHGVADGRGGAGRTGRGRGRRAGARRDVGRTARGVVRCRRAASASTPARTWVASGTPARSSPTTPRSPRRSARCGTTAGWPAVTTSTACSAPTAGSTRCRRWCSTRSCDGSRPGTRRGAGWRRRYRELLDPGVGAGGRRAARAAAACTTWWWSGSRDRDAGAPRLAEQGIGTGIHYPTPCHLHAALRAATPTGRCPWPRRPPPRCCRCRSTPASRSTTWSGWRRSSTRRWPGGGRMSAERGRADGRFAERRPASCTLRPRRADGLRAATGGPGCSSRSAPGARLRSGTVLYAGSRIGARLRRPATTS